MKARTSYARQDSKLLQNNGVHVYYQLYEIYVHSDYTNVQDFHLHNQAVD